MSQNGNNVAVLIVDDSRQYSLVLQKMLTGGFGMEQVDCCDDIDSAYLLVKANPGRYQMLFVDYNFPGGRTGADFLQRLQDESLLEGKSIFMITADPTDQNFKQAQQFGAVGMVAKPFDREQLGIQLDKAFRARAMKDVESF
jgi:DNA-binding NtrC family response regulator